MPRRELTPKQQRFAELYLELGNASEAYRQAYDAENSSNEAIGVEACRLLQHPKVSLEVDRIRDDMNRRNQVTLDGLLDELEAARSLAHASGQGGAAVQATLGKARLAGIGADQQQATALQIILGLPPEQLGEVIEQLTERVGGNLLDVDSEGEESANNDAETVKPLISNDK